VTEVRDWVVVCRYEVLVVVVLGVGVVEDGSAAWGDFFAVLLS